MSNLKINDLFEKVELVKVLRKKESPFLHNLQIIFEQTEQLLQNRVPVVFGNYTLHDIKHSIRVANYMFDIIENNIENVSELDIVILLYAAFLHDVGMVVYAEEFEQIKNNNYTDNKGIKLSIQLSGINKLGWIKNIEDSKEQESLAMQEYIRRIHGFRSKIFVENLYQKDSSFFDIPSFPNISIHEEIGLICESHNESYDWIKDKLKEKQTKGEYTYSPQFCACLLRLADIIEIDERRTPPILFESINPQNRSREEWLQHRIVQNAKKIIHDGGKLTFKFEGECNNAKIHRKIYHYLDWVKMELIGSKALLKQLPQNYFLDIDTDLIRKIESKGNYTIPDNKMSIDFRAVSTLLMGERIYGDKKYGLRELLQNSIDTCRLRFEIENSLRKDWEEPYKPKISIIFDENSKRVIVKDNGMGMTLDIINSNFLSIGKSYYQSEGFVTQGYSHKPIGRFGIGFLACFMLSDEVQIKTRHIESSNLYTINLEKGEEYSSIEHCEENRFEGTEILLKYDQFIESFEDVSEVEKFIQEQIKTEKIDIYIYESSQPARLIDTEFHIEQEDAYIIDASKYLNNIEGCIALEKTKIIYEKIRDLEIEAAIFSYQDGKIIDAREINDNLVISKITNHSQFFRDVLEYFLLTVEDKRDNEFYSYYIFYDNNIEKKEEVEKAIKKQLIEKKFSKHDMKNAEWEIKSFQMYFYNDSGRLYYSIPYYSEHTENQHMVDSNDDKFLSIGKFQHYPFNLYSIYNNGIFVNNDDFMTSWEAMHYTRYTALDIKEYSLNIKEGLELDVSRHSFSKHEEIEEIQDAIIKAMHIAAYYEFDLNEEEKEVLKAFIKKHYTQESIYIREL